MRKKTSRMESERRRVPLCVLRQLSHLSSTKEKSCAFKGASLTDALAAVPSDDWCRNWAADRTVMLRMTSKKVQDAVDQLRPPTVVKLNITFWNDACGETRQKNMNELEKMTSR